MAANLNELIFIKRVKKHPHEAAHGGAWKIAYADFVTAMMAFFLLLWLLSSASQEQRNAISNYFAPQSASLSTSGSGGVLGGRVLDIDGAMTASHSSPRIMLGVPQMEPGTEVEIENPKDGTEINSGPLPKNELKDATGESMGTVPVHDLKARNEAALGTVPENDAKDAHAAALARAKETTGTEPLEGQGGSLGNHDRDTPGLLPDGGGPGELEKGAEEKQLAEIERKLNERIDGDVVLRKYRANIKVERTVEGLRVQILDDDKREMFPLGSAEMLDHTNKLFKTVADLVKNQPNRIAISGHTDATPFRGSGGYSNWELSADRANASRRALMAAGVPENRISSVVGKADTDPMDTVHPNAATNRRVSMVLLRESGGSDAGTGRAATAAAPTNRPALSENAVPTSPSTEQPTPASLPAPRNGATTPPFAAPTVTPPTVTPPTFASPIPEATKPAALPQPEPANSPEPVTAVAKPEAPSAAETPPEPAAPIETENTDGDGDLQDNWLRLR